jgi:hypothetical protein
LPTTPVLLGREGANLTGEVQSLLFAAVAVGGDRVWVGAGAMAAVVATCDVAGSLGPGPARAAAGKGLSQGGLCRTCRCE